MTIFDKGTGPQRPEILNRFGEKLGSGSTRKFLLFGLGIVIALLLLGNYVLSVTRIEAGYTGIEVNLAGSQRGASQIPIRTGWVVFSPLTTQIIEFPTFVQTVKWTKDISEGHPLNEEMGFNS